MTLWILPLLVWQATPPAQVQPAQARAQIAQQIRAAGENLDLGDYNEAIAGLGRALNLVRQAQLARDPIAANVETMLGAALALSNRPTDAVAHFRAALRINAHVKVEERFWKPQVKTAFEQARAQVGPAPTAAPPPPPMAAGSDPPHAPRPVVAPAPTPPPAPKAAPAPVPAPPPPAEDENAPVVGIRARAMAAPEAGRALPIQARVGADVGTPARVMLFYRATGGDKFTEVVMAHNDGSYKAAIPGAAVKLPALQYYVEARDAKNRPLARRGNPDRPLAMPVGVAAATAPAPVVHKPKKAAPAVAPVAPAAPAATPATKKKGEDEENPFDEEHDPTKVVPKAPTK